MNLSKLTANILSHAGANFAGMLVQLLLMTILARKLPTDEFAIFISASALIAIAEMTSDFGTRVSAIKLFSKNAIFENSISIALGSKLIFAAITLVAIPLLPIPLISSFQIFLCIFIAITQPSNDPLLWYCQGKERFDLHAISILTWRIGNSILLILLVFFTKEVNILLFAWLLTNIFRILVELKFIIFKNINWRDESTLKYIFYKATQMAWSSLPIGIAFVLISLFQRLGVFFLGYQSDTFQITLYGAIFSIVASAGFIGTSITLASFPMLNRAIDTQEWNNVKNIMHRKLLLISILFIPACIIGMIITPFAIKLLFGEKYLAGTNVMIFLLAGLYISTINFTLKYVLNALRKNWSDSISAGAGIIVYCVIMLWPMGMITAERAAIAWGCSETAVFFLKWGTLYLDKRLSSKSLLGTFMLSTSLATFAMIIAK